MQLVQPPHRGVAAELHGGDGVGVRGQDVDARARAVALQVVYLKGEL
jgi:hypothetical protein